MKSLYRRVIFPRLLDLVLASERLEGYRRQLLAQVRGAVLEIGFGTGLNLACYPEHIQKITVVDPNPGMGSLARRRIAASPIAVDWQVADAQELPFPNQSFDSVVSTWTLCSIPDVDKALREIRRVLRAGGKRPQPGSPGAKLAKASQPYPEGDWRWLQPRPRYGPVDPGSWVSV